jgi:hypothetical protein
MVVFSKVVAGIRVPEIEALLGLGRSKRRCFGKRLNEEGDTLCPQFAGRVEASDTMKCSVQVAVGGKDSPGQVGLLEAEIEPKEVVLYL